MNPFYTDYAEYIARIFPGRKVQKLSIDAGFTCPNRDGTIATGGCIYCDNRSFSPGYARPHKSVAEQIQTGKAFFARKYPKMQYLAYFQAFTNTYAPASKLRELYSGALAQPDVVGIIIGTRPDCLPPDVVELLADLARNAEVFVETGVETAHDRTLRRINRGHDRRAVEEAVSALAERNIHTGLHLIAGLPGETREDILESVDIYCRLPIESLKIHQMQVIRGTRLHRLYEEGKADILRLTADEYLELCAEIACRVPRRIAIERFISQSPPDLLVYPQWGLKNYQFINLLHARLRNS